VSRPTVRGVVYVLLMLAAWIALGLSLGCVILMPPPK